MWWPVRYLLRHPLPERRGQYIPLYPLRPDNSNHNRYAELLEIGLVLLQRPGTPTENQFARSSPSQGNHPDNHYYLVLVGLASCHKVVVVVNSLKAVTSLYAIPQPIQPVHEMAKTEKLNRTRK